MCDIDPLSQAVQCTKEALELYYRSDSVDQLVTFSSNITWVDVFKSAERARARNDQEDMTVMHSAKPNSPRKQSRKLRRSRTPSILHTLDYAPSEMYIGIICHGLNFIFDVSM